MKPSEDYSQIFLLNEWQDIVERSFKLSSLLVSDSKKENTESIDYVLGKKDILFACDIIDEKTLKTREILKENVGNYPGFLFDHNAFMNALPTKWLENIKEIDNYDLNEAIVQKWENGKIAKTIFGMKNSEIRNKLLSFYKITKCHEHFWKSKLDFDISSNYDVALKATKESRLRLLHFKILHNTYPTIILLHKMHIKPSILCDHRRVLDYFEHFFY